MKKDKSIDELVFNLKNNGASQEEVDRLIELMKDIGMLAQKVQKDFEENPSESTGSVDVDKGLVRGTGFQIHEKAIPDTEEEWELMPKKKDKDAN